MPSSQEEENESRKIPGSDEEELTTAELLQWIEFGSWSALFLFPLLFWFNGPPVSTDQWYCRSLFWAISGVLAVVLWIYRWKTGNPS